MPSPSYLPRDGSPASRILAHISSHGGSAPISALRTVAGPACTPAALQQCLYQLVNTHRLLTKEGRGKSAIYRSPAPHLTLVHPAPIPPTPTSEPTHVEAPLAGDDLDALVRPIAAGLAHRLAEALIRETRAALPAAISEAAEGFDVSAFYKPVERSSLPKVAVVGLSGQFRSLIAAEFSHLYNIRMIETDHVGEAAGNVAGCERVYIATDFVSHKIVERIRAAGGNVILCAGGLSSLREKMRPAEVAK